MKRVAVYGWGVVAPGASNVAEFEEKLAGGGSWLQPFEGFGAAPFLVGNPKFDFADYEDWLSSRFPAGKARQLVDKMDPTTLFAVGAFVQALGQNRGVEQMLRAQGQDAHVYVGNALGAFPTIYEASISLYRAQRRWDRFWAQPNRNDRLRIYLDGGQAEPAAPRNPAAIADPDHRESAENDWNDFWAQRSPQLHAYLEEMRVIEAQGVVGDVHVGKMKVLRDKERSLRLLAKKWGAPPPPWACVSANVLWNIPNAPAAQISMLGGIKGTVVAPAAACSTFSMALKYGLEAIRSGEATMAVIGSADPAPHPMTVGAFYGARVLAADGHLSKPLTCLKGTHVAGGACIWILADYEFGQQQGWEPVGLEPLAVGVSSDAEHIITPSVEGPRRAIGESLAQAGVAPEHVISWDLHATATPGDDLELQNMQSIFPRETFVTARKGTFGHGMGVGGGWELTAQYLGVAAGSLFPTTLSEDELHPALARMGQAIVFDQQQPVSDGPVGKLSMGVGGINTSVISRPWGKETGGRDRATHAARTRPYDVAGEGVKG